MNTVRRLYLYFVSLAGALISMHSILRLGQNLLGGTLDRDVVAFNVALLVVSLPVYLFHWFLAQRAVHSGQDQRHDAARKFYLYAVLLTTFLAVGFHAHVLLHRLFLAVLGITARPTRAQIGSPLAAVIVAGLFWLYHRYLANHDRLDGGETEPGAIWGRFYLYLAAVSGVALFAVGFADLLHALLRNMVSASLDTQPNLDVHLARDVASLLVGGAGWVIHWVWAQRLFRSDRAEQRSTVRKVYLYVAVLVPAIIALTSLSLLLHDFLRLLMGAPNPGHALILDRVTWPVVLIAEGAIFWVYHWWVLQMDMRQTTESSRQANIRRLYYYLVSGAGLVLVGWGLAHLAGAIVAAGAFWTQQTWGGHFVYQFSNDWFREQVSLNVAMLLVGIPVWVWHWRTVNRQASETDSPLGIQERRSVLRKTYIYLALFAAAIILLSQPAEFLFRLLKVWLGAPVPNDFWDQIAGEVSNSAVAALLWLYHGIALRRDRQLGEELAPLQAGATAPLVLVVAVDSGELGCEVVQQVRRELPAVRIAAIGRGEEAQAALTACVGNAPPNLSDALQEAAVIVTPLSLLLADSGGETSLVARKVAGQEIPCVLIPTPAPHLVVAGVRAKSVRDLAHAAAQQVAQYVAERN